MTYLPFYFGSYVCTKCEINLETELKLLNHILKKEHIWDENTDFNIKIKRHEYFSKEHNHYFGTKNIKFEESDINYFLNHKAVSEFDVQPVLNKLSNLTQGTMEFNSKTAASAFEAVTSEVSFTTPFEENVIKAENYLPPPPVSRMPPRRKVATVPRPSNISLEILDQRVQNLELKFDQSVQNLELKLDTLEQSVQALRDEMLTRNDHIISYQRQLFQAITCQFKDLTIELFSKSLQGALQAAATSLSVQSPQSDR